ncbi:MAG TPA: acyltransferase [Terriglobales bacterium]|nr:acyltransferase [Terriglobales bacterium]
MNAILTSVSAKPKIGIVGALRGFAALAVVWFHFTFGQTPWLKWSGQYGWLGVETFFVISGFIIPYSLYQYRYEIRDYFRFLGKRLVRLHPPYLASIVVVIATYLVTVALYPHANISRLDLSPSNFASHFFYLNDFVHKEWFNVVYWTLSIELQWYLLLGLVFPFLASRRWYVQIAATIILLITHRLWLRNMYVIFHILPVFLIGVFVFQYRVGLSSVWRMLLSVAAMCIVMKTPIGIPVTIVASATGMLIAFATLENRWCLRLGEISYSVYLLHVPVGLTLMSPLSHLPYSGSYMIVIDLVCTAACIAASVLFYRWIEEPSQKWSSAIKMKPVKKKVVKEELVPATASAD